MTGRRSTVADYLKTHPGPLRRKGGRGVRGRLSLWLIEERESIAKGRAAGRLGWPEVATIAAKDGVHGPDGQPVDPRVVSNKWNALLKKGIVRNVLVGAPLPDMPSRLTTGGFGTETAGQLATAVPPVRRFDLLAAEVGLRLHGAATPGHAGPNPSPEENQGPGGPPAPPVPRPAADLDRWIRSEQMRKGLA